MNDFETKEKIKTFLAKSFNIESIAEEDDIFALGLVNSLFAMQLVLFVEETFNFKVENDELDLDNFKSVAAIAGYINKKINPN